MTTAVLLVFQGLPMVSPSLWRTLAANWAVAAIAAANAIVLGVGPAVLFAQAVAETEVVALRLTSSAFDGIMAEQPALAAKILRNLTLQLANRVRDLTGDLAQWVERSAHGRSANEPAMSLVAPASEDGRD